MSLHKTVGKGARKYSWAEIAQEPLSAQITRRVVTGEQAMAAQITVAAGGIVPQHSHMNEQLSYVLKGSLRFWLGKHVESDNPADSLIVSAGEVLVIPSHVPHRAVALMDTLILDIFAPPRQDWLNGTDSYFKPPLTDS